MADLLVPFAGDSAPELAERLIGRFGSLARAMAASPRQLIDAAQGHERACTAILGAQRLVDAALGENIVRSRVSGDEDSLHRYLRARLTLADTELLHVVFCDARGGYLADETVCEGSLVRIEARIRPVIERALALGAAGFLLAHNHPSGICRPSREDIAGTRRIREIAAALELELIDHLIVTRRSVYSMRAGGCF